MAEMTFYPDANPETTSVDGAIAYTLTLGSGITWSALMAVTEGTDVYPSDNQVTIAAVGSDSQTDRWLGIIRAIYLFDTSELSDDAEILSATFSVYGYQKGDTGSWAPSTNIYSAAPATDTDLVVGDFDSLGSTPYCDTAIAYDDWDTSGFNAFALNATGIAAISKTGITKIGLRFADYDVNGVEPTWASYKSAQIRGYFAEQSNGNTYKPKLVVTYASLPTVTTQAVSNISTTTATGNGNITVLGDPAPTAHGVCYNTAGSPTIADDVFDEGAAVATGAFTSSMTGLSINTKYYVKAYATNTQGTSYGSEVNFTTLGVPTVTTQTSESVVGATATGRGEITVIGNPTPTAHGHCWNTTADPVITDDVVNNGAASVIGTFISAITGLTPGTGYYTRAYATNTQGTVYGANVYFVAPSGSAGGAIGSSGSRAGYTFDESSNLRSFDQNAIERQYLHYDSLDSLDHNVNITAGNSFTCDNVTARILQGITGLTVTDSPTFLALTIGDLTTGYMTLHGTADYPIDLYSVTVNTGGADIRLSNQAKIDNTTHDLLKMSVSTSDYFRVGNPISTIKGTFLDLDLSQALRFIGTGNIDGEVVFRDKLTVGRPANGVDFILYGVTANYRVMWDANGDTNGRWTFGDDDYGVDVAFRGHTTGKYILWDASADTLILGNAILKLYSGADLIVYSDAGSTEVARIDGATGAITTSSTVDGIDVSAHDVATTGVHGAGANTIASTGTKLDDFATPDDNTDLNSTTTEHGLLKKLDNTATNFMNGQGNWSAPAGGASSAEALAYALSN